jgi:hypothetical protein
MDSILNADADNDQDKRRALFEQCPRVGSRDNQGSAVARNNEGQECKLIMKSRGGDLRSCNVEKSKANSQTG